MFTAEDLINRRVGFWVESNYGTLFKAVDYEHTYRYEPDTKTWTDVGFIAGLGYDPEYTKVSEEEALKVAGVDSWE